VDHCPDQLVTFPKALGAGCWAANAPKLGESLVKAQRRGTCHRLGRAGGLHRWCRKAER